MARPIVAGPGGAGSMFMAEGPMTLAEQDLKPVQIYPRGRLRVEVDGVELRHKPTGQDKSIDLLKLLAAQDSGGAPISQLSAALWPSLGGEEASQELSRNVDRLCGLIGPNALVTDNSHLALNTERIWVDAIALAHELMLSGEAVDAGEGAAAFQHVEKALAYYGGALPPVRGDGEFWRPAG